MAVLFFQKNLIEKDKVKVYIDGSNIFHAQKKLGWFLDWVKVKKYLQSDYQILEWRYYIGVKDADEGMVGFLRYLNAIGIKAITKPLKKIALDSGDAHIKLIGQKYVYKANFDVEITADILLDSGEVKEIILFSGDSDFVHLIERLAAKVIYIEDLKDRIMRK